MRLIWLSVDPMYSERSWLTPYNYVQNNPVNLVDPDGMLDGWVEGEGGIFWDSKTNSKAEFDENYAGKTGYNYASDIDNPLNYTLPDGSGKLTIHSWNPNGQDGVYQADIDIEFIPSFAGAEVGWVQTFLSTNPDDHSNLVTIPGLDIEERLDGSGVQQSTDLNQARYFHGDKGYGVPRGRMVDAPRRTRHAAAQSPLVMNMQSTAVMNGKPVVSLQWGFTINTNNMTNSTIVRSPNIVNFSQTTNFHQGAVNSVINRSR